MQIIVFGLHEQNVPEKIWHQGKYEIDSFYRFISPLNDLVPNSEFLFVNSSYAREILAVVENAQEIKHKFKEFYHSHFNLKKPVNLIFHDLEGPDAVKHFLQLSLGIESTIGTQQQEFLQRISESIEVANNLNLAGPIINRIYHDALILQGKIKIDSYTIDQTSLSRQIRELVKKIFFGNARLDLFIIGKNETYLSLIISTFSNSVANIKIYSVDVTAETPDENYRHYVAGPEIESRLLASQVIFRLNQEAGRFFNADTLNKLMQKRKNRPLLIINMDSTIAGESALNRVYNLYNYHISDFQHGEEKQSVKINLQRLIENELKEFFSWFYSKRYHHFGNIISKSTAMEHILEMIARISQTDITVLIQGESGTGKEIIARAIHRNSRRKDKPFIVVNCSALTETLLESELFGHERGAFTGATYTKKGLFEEAHQGSIFLDEIGDTSPALQVKLLRVLQEGEIKRVGSTETTRIDVRLIAATNQNLDDLVREKRFRQDLYYRLNVVNLNLPPLRERKEDILPLAEYFMGKYSDKMKKQITGFTERVRQILVKYSWPGNVRELENAIERAVALAIGNIVHTGDLPEAIRGEEAAGFIREKINKNLTLKEIEREAIHANLIATNWNYDKVADMLKIGRTTLWRKMKEYGISRRKND
ncbi:MAG TPA: AAA family ATPase [Bacteroidetes bacterium]|nr:AAA family ATPase [Bacteroidota bacterium]